MRKQQTRVICVALLTAGLAALGFASAALGRIGKTGLSSFTESANAENSPPDQLVHISGVTENRKVFSAQAKLFLGIRSVPLEAATTRSENSRSKRFCEQIQLTDCLA
jgi:hypothetical protein